MFIDQIIEWIDPWRNRDSTTCYSKIHVRGTALGWNHPLHWEHTIRAVTVRAINLQSQDIPQQLQFFADPFQVEKKEKLETVVEDIRRRFGKYAIQPACLYQDLKMAPNDVELKMPTGLIG